MVCRGRYPAFLAISFPELTRLLVSTKASCLGTDQKTRGLWEQEWPFSEVITLYAFLIFWYRNSVPCMESRVIPIFITGFDGKGVGCFQEQVTQRREL